MELISERITTRSDRKLTSRPFVKIFQGLEKLLGRMIVELVHKVVHLRLARGVPSLSELWVVLHVWSHRSVVAGRTVCVRVQQNLDGVRDLSLDPEVGLDKKKFN